MDFQLEILKQSRNNLLAVLEPFDTNQLNMIPPGFKNNLAWNLGHVIVSQQILCYQFSGLPVIVPNEWVAQFRRGTTPDIHIIDQQIDEMKSMALEVIDAFIEDYSKGTFKQYQGYQTLFGVHIKNIDDAIVFNNTHEGLHFGYMMAMSKLI